MKYSKGMYNGMPHTYCPIVHVGSDATVEEKL
jgi:hypothetical protein